MTTIHFAEYSIFCKVKQALVHVTWYGAAMQLFDHHTARKWALCSRCTAVSYVQPPDSGANDAKTAIIHHGHIGLLSFF
jgi:hypothetical protein